MQYMNIWSVLGNYEKCGFRLLLKVTVLMCAARPFDSEFHTAGGPAETMLTCA